MKRTTSLLMAICMVFALMVNASAFELSAEDTVKPADPIQQMVDEKMAVILPQLAAQDALYLADDYEAILYAMFSAEYDENSISPLEDGTVNNVYAPRGGSVAYKQAREWGAVPGRFVVVGCTAEQGERWINEVETQRDVARAIMEAVKTLNWLPPYITGSANALLYTTVSINQSILNDIQSCNGRVMVLNTISYIDNAAHPAVMGWPTTSIPVPYNATEIVSRVN